MIGFPVPTKILTYYKYQNLEVIIPERNLWTDFTIWTPKKTLHKLIATNIYK